MKLIMIAVFSILILPGAVAAQSDDPFAIISKDTTVFGFLEGVGIPPRGSIIVYGSPFRFHEDIYYNDADWYFNDLPRGRPRRSRPEVWSSLNHAQVQNLIAEVFEEALGEFTWEEYLQKDNTLIRVTANGNVIYVINEDVLHVIDMSSNVVITIDYVKGVRCSTLEGEGIPDDLPPDKTIVMRCYHVLHLNVSNPDVRLMKDPASIKIDVLQALNSLSPFEYEKTHMSIYHHLSPSEIWFYDWPSDDTGPIKYIKLDDRFNLGVRMLSEIAFGEHLIRIDFRTHEYSSVQEDQLRARDVILSSLERILSANGKWLLEVSGWGEPILIRNLSTLYTREETQ